MKAKDLSRHTGIPYPKALRLLNGERATLNMEELVKIYEICTPKRTEQVLGIRDGVSNLKNLYRARQISEATGLSNTKVWRVLNGIVDPRLSDLEKLQAAGYLN